MTGADVAAQEASLAQAQLNLSPLQKQLAQQRDALTTLAGKFPSEEIAQTFDLDTLHLPVRLPSVCRPTWSGNVLTCARPRKTCLPPAPT